MPKEKNVHTIDWINTGNNEPEREKYLTESQQALYNTIAFSGEPEEIAKKLWIENPENVDGFPRDADSEKNFIEYKDEE